MITLASAQSSHYQADYDYNSESPHLKHRQLYEGLMARVAGLVGGMPVEGRPVRALEVGAGDGSVSSRLLELGCEVTGTEMSEDSVETMNSRFAGNDRFRAVHDPDGSLGVLGGDRFDLVLYASVLHHIPDYLAAIGNAVSNHLRPGGGLVSIQDPLYYPRMSPLVLRFQSAAYLSWRLAQGNFARGVRTRVRRTFQGLSEEAPGDAVEYHVVRDGVDEQAIVELLAPDFSEVETVNYWSSQGTLQQRAGEKFGFANTFAIFAREYHPRGESAGDS